MATDQWVTPAADNARISVQVVTDPPGRSETPALSRPRIAVHLGRTVYMVCQHGALKHRGWGVHGDIDIVPAGTQCVWEPDGPDTALIVGMESDLLEDAAQELGVQTGQLEVVNRFQIRDTQIEHICFALKCEMEAGYPTGRLFLDSLSTALASAMVLRHSSAARAPFPSHQSMSGRRLRLALSYIEDNLKHDLSMSAIAKAAGVSITHLKTAFRQITGTSVHQYVIQRRVERARSLLASGSSSVSEVAQEAGFAHQSHLARHMQRILGCSPTTFRKLSRSTSA
jgi:AraC family transcriptional regulator